MENIENRLSILKQNNVENIIKNAITNSLYNLKIVQVESRIKTYDSIVEKINRKNYKSIDEVKDLLGIRIICKNIDDVYKIQDRIINIFEDSKVKDYIKKHKDGYRGIHIYNKVNIKNIKDIPLEIQIKTVAMKKAQDKTHDKIYKNNHIPNFIKKILNVIISNYIIIKDRLVNKNKLSENYM